MIALTKNIRLLISSDMRYSAEHKQQTRERIVRAASKTFRKKGAQGIAIADLMKELRLTHGGFYRHFSSKQQLFVEALTKALGEGEIFLKRATERAKKGKELNSIIEMYLNNVHCLDTTSGCPMAALASEVARQPKAVRQAFDRGLRMFISKVVPFVPGKSVKERELKAHVLFSGMMGALNMARAVSDEALREEILKSSREMYIQAFCNP